MIRGVVFLRDLIRAIRRDDIPGASAELAFRFLFALFPFFIFLAALSGFVMSWLGVADPSGRVVTAIGDMLPRETTSLLEEQLRDVLETTRGGLLSASALIALWAASTGTRTLMKMIDRAHGVEGDRPLVSTYILSLILTLLAAGAFVGGFVLLVVGRALAEILGLEGIWATVIDLARIPVVFLAVLAAVTFVYRVAPSVAIPPGQALPGAVVAVALWLTATLGFVFYLSNFGAYGETYGALGAVVVLMLWFYITALVLLLGAEVNAIIASGSDQLEAEATEAEAAAESLH